MKSCHFRAARSFESQELKIDCSTVREKNYKHLKGSFNFTYAKATPPSETERFEMLWFFQHCIGKEPYFLLRNSYWLCMDLKFTVCEQVLVSTECYVVLFELFISWRQGAEKELDF